MVQWLLQLRLHQVTKILCVLAQCKPFEILFVVSETHSRTNKRQQLNHLLKLELGLCQFLHLVKTIIVCRSIRQALRQPVIFVLKDDANCRTTIFTSHY